MTATNENDTFVMFLTDNFKKDDTFLGLPMEEKNGKMIGTKNNLTLEQIKQVHEDGFTNTDKGRYYAVKKQDATHFELRLKYTDNIVCVDIDGIKENGDCSLEEVMNIPIIKEVLAEQAYTLSRKKKLPHFYFKVVGLNTQTLSNTYLECFKDFKGDLLINHCWEKIKDNQVYNYDEYGLLKIQYDDLKKMLNDETIAKIENAPKKKTNNHNDLHSNDLLKKMVDLIDDKYCNKRDHWLKIVNAMKKSGFTQEEARQWSMKSDRYSESGFNSAWDQYPIELITATDRTIHYYAKKSNPIEYNKMTAKKFPTEPTDRDFAELFWELKQECCIVSCGVIYIFYKNQWRIIEKKEPHILRTIIGDTIREYFENNLTNKEDMKEYTATLNNLKEICKKNKLSNVTSFVIDKMYSEHCDTEDIFDNKPYIFSFKNKAFDLQTGELYDIKKEDYITQNTGYDYVEPTTQQLEAVTKVFHSIFPDPEVGKCYLSVLRLCLSGEHPEKLFLANGGGRNGKGVLNELMFTMLGDYAYTLSIEVLTKDVKKTGPNPELANMHKKRMVVSREPEDGTKLQMGIIKEITGGNEISARGLYNGNTKTLLNCVSIVECNKKPLLNGRMDTSVLERIVDIPFESTFVSNPDDVDECRGIYQGNPLYKTDAWQKEHSCAMFHFILENAEKTLYVPLRIKNLSKQYVLGSDEMYSWVMENYEPATDFDKQYIKLKDMFDLYKASDLYSNLTKLERRNLNKKAFSELISNHIVLKKQFRNNMVKIEGKTVNCERIHGLVLKVEECDTDDEEVGYQG